MGRRQPTKRSSVLISVDDEHLNRMSEVTSRLKTAGVKVDQVMDTLGTITGSADPSKLPALRRVRGVAAVEEAREAQIAPPESEVQ